VAKIATLVDDFTASSLSTSTWDTNGPSVLYGGQAVTMSIVTTQNNLQTDVSYDLVSSAVYAKMAMPATGAGGHQISMRVSTGSPTATNDEARWFRNGVSSIDARVTVGGVTTVLATLAYDTWLHGWLRIRHDGTLVCFDTSPDGLNWTQRASTALVTWDLTIVYLRFTSVMFGAETGSTVVQHVNTPGLVFPDVPLPIKTELNVAGTWTDITSKVYQRDAIQITRGRQDESAPVNPTTCNLTLNNRDGRFSPRNPSGAYYGQFGRNSQIRLSIRQSAGWLQINQPTDTTATPTYVTTPDNAALDLTGDLDLRFEADLDSWRDAMELIGKWAETGNQRSYRMYLQSAGTLVLEHSVDGIATLAVASTLPVPIIAGRLAVRATLDVNDGGGNRVRQFFTAPTLAGPWTQLGTTRTTAGVTSVFSSSAALRILDNPDGSVGSIIRGRVYGAQVLATIGGTAVANPDFTVQSEGTTSFTDVAGRTWTLVGDLTITFYDRRFTGEVSAWPTRWDTTGRDIYTQITASGVSRRLGQGSVLNSTLYRTFSKDANLVAYWPMEDGSDAVSFGSAVGGGVPMRLGPNTSTAADSSFACSRPLPTVGDAPLRGVVRNYTSTGEVSVQFICYVPSATATATTNLCDISMAGTATRWSILLTTAGTLSLRVQDADGVTLATYGPAWGVNGLHFLVRLTMKNNGTAVDSTLTTYFLGDPFVTTLTQSLASNQIGKINSATLNLGGFSDYNSIVMGHLAISKTITSVFDVLSQVNAWNGELATSRIKRLCDEEDVPFAAFGARSTGDSALMGPQLPDTLQNLLQECATADGGILYEGRDFSELRYRPAHAMYAQPAELTLSYPGHQMNNLEPVEDDQLTRNDVTVMRVNGGSARSTVTTGPLSVNDPADTPPGVGRYEDSVTLNVQDDTVLLDQAGWRTHLGTVAEARYPNVDLTLESIWFAALRTTVVRLDLGDRISITSPPVWTEQLQINQLLQGYTEYLNTFEHHLSLNLTPAAPWDVATYNDTVTTRSRYASGSSITNEALDTTETGVDVIAGTKRALWTTTAGSWPFGIIIGGEVMTVTAVSAAVGLTQTLTVTRSVNGVVKSHLTGATVELYPLSYYGV
jgi:hypothetical protein